jgi:hypothetical protein
MTMYVCYLIICVIWLCRHRTFHVLKRLAVACSKLYHMKVKCVIYFIVLVVMCGREKDMKEMMDI